MTAERAGREDQGREAVTAPVPQPDAAQPHVTQLAGFSARSVLALQRSSGNQAVSRYLARERGWITTAELANRWRGAKEAHPLHPRRPDVRFRVPTAATIKSMMAGGEVPEDKIKDSIATALKRMQSEKKLKSADAIPDIMLRLFPAPGTFDEAEFAKVIDVADRNQVYEKAADAEAKLKPADKVKVLAAMDKADTLLDAAIADSANLPRVFGTKASVAKANYVKAKAALAKLKTNIDTKVHTDYNLDDPQVGLGGWARFAEQMVHLKPSIAAGTNVDDAAFTIVHECAHLSDATVKDKGYYPPDAANSSGWDAMTDDEKVTNAAHYEEIPRRHAGKSVYKADQEFKPGISAATGGAVSFETQVRRLSSEYLRKSWDTAVSVHKRLRDIRIEIEKGNTATFKAKEARIVEISKLAKLTIHDQKPAPRTITLLDLTLSEGVARSTRMIRANAAKEAVPAAPAGGKTAQDYADEVVVKATAAYGALTGNPGDDKKLLDWLVAHYKAAGL